MMKMKKSILSNAIAAAILAGGSFAANAAPLSAGTKLMIDAGVGSGANAACSAGSCFAMEVAPGFVAWTDIGPGTDGGFIIGKDQVSGGQEIGPSPENPTPGEISSAWNFFSNFGTFYTPTGTSNYFDDANCAGASCIGVTQLGSFNVAWNGNAVPMGSVAGCNSGVCSPDQLAGIFIEEWTVDTVNNRYILRFNNVVPNADPSGFGNVKFQLIARGDIVPVPVPAAVWLFGSGLVGLAGIARRRKTTV